MIKCSLISCVLLLALVIYIYCESTLNTEMKQRIILLKNFRKTLNLKNKKDYRIVDTIMLIYFVCKFGTCSTCQINLGNILNLLLMPYFYI